MITTSTNKTFERSAWYSLIFIQMALKLNISTLLFVFKYEDQTHRNGESNDLGIRYFFKLLLMNNN